MACRFSIMDVFCERPLAGNQLAVVRDCEHLNDGQMQAIAREFNFSETVFILPPADPVNSARVRIFTPALELSFAGHPTVGAAVLIALEDAPDMVGQRELVIALEENVGLVSCAVRRPQGRTTRATFSAPQLPEKLDDVSHDIAARALSLDIADIGFDRHGATIYAVGNAFAFVPVASLDAANRAEPNMMHWGALTGDRNLVGAFVYTKDAAGEDAHVHARMFAPEYGIAEDPATGSAVAAFAGVCLEFERPPDGEHQILIEQGVKMGRPSELVLTMDVRGGVFHAVTVGGAAVIVGSGTLNL